MDLSIVTTLYQSAPYLEEFYARSCAAAEKITDDYEIIFVNDGSPDDSLRIVLGFYERDRKVRVIDLSRNFGHHKAIMTGLARARGGLVFLIDCDLEEDPEWLLDFHDKMQGSGSDVDVVYGVQEQRKGGLFERISGELYYAVFNALSKDKLPRDLITVRLMTERYVKNLLQHGERETILAGLWAITGFNQLPIKVPKKSKGDSAYDLRRKVSILVNSVTSFSNRPLIFIFYLGGIIVLLSSLAAAYLIMRKIFLGDFLAGWPSLVVSVWFLGGLTIFCIGLIGIYLSRVFIETKQRPYTVIKQVYERKMEER
jgi:putative glycosyltransferase